MRSILETTISCSCLSRMLHFTAKAVVALVLVFCGCHSLLCTAAPDAVVLHTSLVDLLNADKSQWTLSLASGDAAAAWKDMREVWVEGQPLESAAALLFALPPPASSYYHTAEDVEVSDAPGDRVLLRAQRRQLFGHPSHSFHGLTCEEYGAAAVRPRHGGVGGEVRGRCYLMRDAGEDVFFHYRVADPGNVKAATAEEGGDGTSSRRRRARTSGDAATAPPRPVAKAAAVSSGPQTSSHTSEGALWSEFVVLPGAEAGVVGSENDVHVGSVRVAEQLTKAMDVEDSTRVELAFTVTFAEGATTPANTLHMRVRGVTGAYCVAAAREATMTQQAARTSFFNRWLFPVVYVGCLYGMVYGVAWLQASRKASAATANAAAAATAKLSSAAAVAAPKKRQ